MMGYIQGQAPATKGKWNIATVPGGGGSWGGSFLTVTKQSQHPAEAADLVKFLTSPASELYVFKHTGNLPSEVPVLKSKSVQTFKNPFFSNAPVGKIFANSALKLKPQILGPHQGDFQTAATNAIQRVEQRKQSPAAAWKQFLKDVKTRRLTRELDRPGRHPSAARPASITRTDDEANDDGAVGASGSRRGADAPRAASSARREGLAVPLRRAVLRRLRHLRTLPARVHRVRLAHRPEPAQPGLELHRAAQLRAPDPRLVLLERGREHVRDLVPLDRAAARARARDRARAQHARCACAPSSAWPSCCRR